MSDILFVVHRYYPYPGGSEYYVRDMAIEMKNRGHEITILAHEHQGNQDNIIVTNDYNILNQKFDLIIVHGADCISQNIVLMNINSIKSPVLYLIIKPSDSLIARHGMKNAKYLGYSTSMDLEHIRFPNNYYLSRARRVRHGINPKTTIKQSTTPIGQRNYYVSAGGFWLHKGMQSLANNFELFGPPNTYLKLYGYGEQQNMPKNTSKVSCYYGAPRDIVMEAIANSRGYIMNSYEEGFGLVLLEAMLNNVPCYARNIAGAADMKNYVITYDTEDSKDLFSKIKITETVDMTNMLQQNYEYVMTNHTIHQTGDDLEDIIREEMNE
jgi:glycosyltransferase involved in cell wall biosynthesis